jgi:hypothetical protein
MRNASRPSAAPTPLASDSYVEKQEQNTFTLIASALHASRHCQGRRILRQYDHLIADAKMRISHELSQNSGGQKPPVTGRPDQETWAAKLSATSEMGLACCRGTRISSDSHSHGNLAASFRGRGHNLPT